MTKLSCSDHCIYVRGVSYEVMNLFFRGAGMAQWVEHFPPTNWSTFKSQTCSHKFQFDLEFKGRGFTSRKPMVNMLLSLNFLTKVHAPF